MKALVLIVALLTPLFAQAATEVKVIKTGADATVTTKSFCMFGKQFITSTVEKTGNSNGAGGVIVTQVMERDEKLGIVPMACKELQIP